VVGITRALMLRLPVSLLAAVCALAFAATVATAAPPAPNATTGGTSGVDQTVATVAGTVDPNGATTVYWFEYGTSTPDHKTDERSAGTGDGGINVSAQIGGLKAGTKYVYRVVARNDGGTVPGATRSFTTDRAPATPPTVSTGGTRDVAQSGATLTGSINTRGRTGTYAFQYGPTTAYGASTAATPIGPTTSSVAVASPAAGLAPATRYHYRLVLTLADNGGTIRGADHAFTTAKVPNGLLIVATPNPVRYGGAISIAGILAGTGNAGVTVSVQADPFPLDNAWTTVTSGKTDATGAYRIALSPLLVTSALRTVAATSPAVISQPTTIGVTVSTSLSLSTTRPHRGSRVRFRGRVTPAQAGASVSIQRRVNGRYRTIARTIQRAGSGASSYSRRVRITHSGRYRAVARTTDGGHLMGASRSRLIHVRR
jgi:hypothetical protein